jgi:hypothetical protein
MNHSAAPGLPGPSEQPVSAAPSKTRRPPTSRSPGRQLAEQCVACAFGFSAGISITVFAFKITGTSGLSASAAEILVGALLAVLAWLGARTLQLQRDAVQPLHLVEQWDHAMGDLIKRYPNIIVYANSPALFSPSTRALAKNYSAALESRLADASSNVSVLYLVQERSFSWIIGSGDLARRKENAGLLKSRLDLYLGNPRIKLYAIRAMDMPSAVIGLDEHWTSGGACIGFKGKRGEVLEWGIRVGVPSLVVFLAKTYQNLQTSEGSRLITTQFWDTDISPLLGGP